MARVHFVLLQHRCLRAFNNYSADMQSGLGFPSVRYHTVRFHHSIDGRSAREFKTVCYARRDVSAIGRILIMYSF